MSATYFDAFLVTEVSAEAVDRNVHLRQHNHSTIAN